VIADEDTVFACPTGNLVLSSAKHAWSLRPPFDPRNECEGMRAQGEVVIAFALQRNTSDTSAPKV